VRILASADVVSEFYWQLLINLDADRADGLLVVGNGGDPQGVSLTAYAYPEIVNRRLLAIAADDQPALDSLRGDLALEGLWLTGPPPKGAVVMEGPAGATAAEQTAWMAHRWQGWARGYLLGGPELAGRWVPYAVRNQLPALFGIPQRQVVQLMREPLSQHGVVIGEALEGHDLHELSRTGAALQVVGPGRPPFPVLSRAAKRPALPPSRPDGDPDDGQLERWATEGRVLATLLLWTGGIGELESLYLLTDLMAVTRIACGLVLTTASFDHMPHPPLTLLGLDRQLGGLAPLVEPLLGSAGNGSCLESETPQDRLAAGLKASLEGLAERLGGPDRLPAGWWGLMDAPLRQGFSRWLGWRREPRYLRTGERPRLLDLLFRRAAAGPEGREHDFDRYSPGPPARSVLEAVRDAGFQYAFTKSGFGPTPLLADVEGITVLNHTAGAWLGSPPFVAVGGIQDLREAQRGLQRRQGPGWLVGTLAAGPWTLEGSRWQRAGALEQVLGWVSGGGDGGRMINAPPRVVARYAELLGQKGLVERINAR
ncbi:MAG: hypothetical protein J2P45_10960, partial [Candidatus Dormibacteraeota bacterium]|nr:hypothetical protein [Candidatus Dormibacteraeota bacterium]